MQGGGVACCMTMRMMGVTITQLVLKSINYVITLNLLITARWIEREGVREYYSTSEL